MSNRKNRKIESPNQTDEQSTIQPSQTRQVSSVLRTPQMVKNEEVEREGRRANTSTKKSFLLTKRKKLRENEEEEK